MASPSLIDAARSPGTKKTKVLRGERAKEVLDKVSKKDETVKKERPQAEKRKAMYGRDK
jgi:hypothetical protein